VALSCGNACQWPLSIAATPVCRLSTAV
jgi:hypothetical protein